LSDHSPIFLQFGTSAVRPSLPFKLNSCWLIEEGFINIVKTIWNDPNFLSKTGIQQRFTWKLKHLKSKIESRATQHTRHTLHHLQELEKNIKDLQIFEPIDGHNGTRQQQLKLFEA